MTLVRSLQWRESTLVDAGFHQDIVDVASVINLDPYRLDMIRIQGGTKEVLSFLPVRDRNRDRYFTICHGLGMGHKINLINRHRSFPGRCAACCE